MRHRGTANFIALRASAVVLLPLVGWFLYEAAFRAGASEEEARAWLSEPPAALCAGLLILISAFHMRIGMNEIIDDYAQGGYRGVWKLLNLFACLGAAILGLWSLYRLAA
jgi:succinate dehydrogenase / fumarate reductase membrane anchor subunit